MQRVCCVLRRFVWQNFHGGNLDSSTGHKFAPDQDQDIWCALLPPVRVREDEKKPCSAL